jgi:hypothetical protein
MGRPKKAKESASPKATKKAKKVEAPPAPEPEVADQTPTEKSKLLALYEELKSRGIRSLSDLENLIARAE